MIKNVKFSFLPDKNIMAKNAKVLIVSELANEYGMKDIGGMFQYVSCRNIGNLI